MSEKFPWGNVDIGLLLLRIGVGIIFIAAGWMKVSAMDATITNFSAMGFSAFWAYVAAYTEFLGGIAVLLGIYTWVASALLAITMLVAVYVVHGNPTMAIAPFSLLFSSLTLLFTGGGKYSIIKNK